MTKRYSKPCIVCGTALLQPGGYANTEMCGPCCTGDADTVRAITTTCLLCSGVFEQEIGDRMQKCHACTKATRKNPL